MKKIVHFGAIAVSSLCATVTLALSASPNAHAANFLDNLKGQAQQQMGGGQPAATNGTDGTASALSGALGSLGMPAMSSSTGTNAAGVLAYCAKNNYLNASNAQSVKNKLLSKVGLSSATAQQDNGYREGAAGLLQGNNGTSLNMDNIKSNLRQKACDYVLSHAKSFI